MPRTRPQGSYGVSREVAFTVSFHFFTRLNPTNALRLLLAYEKTCAFIRMFFFFFGNVFLFYTVTTCCELFNRIVLQRNLDGGVELSFVTEI